MSLFETLNNILTDINTKPNIPTIPRIKKNGSEGGEVVGGELVFELFTPPAAAIKAHAGGGEISLEFPTIDFFPAPDTFEGRPCCYLPQETPERLRGIMPPDLQGLGVPMQGLPLVLRGISACGWRPELVNGRLELRPVRADARNEEGVLGYFSKHREKIESEWGRWKEAIPKIQKRSLEMTRIPKTPNTPKNTQLPLENPKKGAVA